MSKEEVKKLKSGNDISLLEHRVGQIVQNSDHMSGTNKNYDILKWILVVPLAIR